MISYSYRDVVVLVLTILRPYESRNRFYLGVVFNDTTLTLPGQW